MENENTTIDIKKDVFARLVQESKNKQEPFNTVLRRILDMDPAASPQEGEPHFYEGKIEIDGLNVSGTDRIIRAIINHPDYDGSLHDRTKINDVDVRIDVDQPVIITVKADTEEEVLKKMKAVIDRDTMMPEINRKYVNYRILGLMEVDCKTGERLEKATSYD